MYKPLADSTLMSMTKRELIDRLRIAEHNQKVADETLGQQAKNVAELFVYKPQLVNQIGELEVYEDFVEPSEIKFVKVDDVLRLLQ